MFSDKFRKKGLMWVSAALLVHFLSYYLPKLIVSSEKMIMMSTGLDDKLPLVPVFILVYVGAYFQWAWYYLRQACSDDGEKRKYLLAEAVGKIVCCVIYIVYPVTMTRPEVLAGGLCGWILRLIYAVDTPFCLFPSIHCLQSWICLRYAIRFESKRYAIFSAVFSALVFASTVLVKQHLWPDAVAGIVLAEVCIFLVSRFSLKKKVRESAPAGGSK